MFEDTCEFNKAQLEDKTQFYGVLYANDVGFGEPTFCTSNMDSYYDSVLNAEYMQTDELRLQRYSLLININQCKLYNCVFTA